MKAQQYPISQNKPLQISGDDLVGPVRPDFTMIIEKSHGIANLPDGQHVAFFKSNNVDSSAYVPKSVIRKIIDRNGARPWGLGALDYSNLIKTATSATPSGGEWRVTSQRGGQTTVPPAVGQFVQHYLSQASSYAA